MEWMKRRARPAGRLDSTGSGEEVAAQYLIMFQLVLLRRVIPRALRTAQR
jgi:hypothetical protein